MKKIDQRLLSFLKKVYYDSFDEISIQELIEKIFPEYIEPIFQDDISFKKENVELDLPDAELFSLMKTAHQQNLTFNKYIENILRDAANGVFKENN